MKVRKNKRFVMARLKHNKQHRWVVMSIIKAGDERRKSREKIQAIIDKQFPELKGIPCPSWI
jgi:hypothetical protein